MHEPVPHFADYQLVQNCLEGDERAMQELQHRFTPIMEAYLRRMGATNEEMAEVTGGLWSDCLAARPDRRPRLANYAGNATLQTWLYPLVLNRWLACKHRQAQWQKIHAEEVNAEEIGVNRPALEGIGESAEAPLLNLMRDALQASFLACPAKDFVLLQLAHSDGLRVVELARMFGCGIAKISRDLESAREGIATATLAYIRRTDPWLDLKWDDFVELCRVASPPCFGVD